MSQPLPKHWIQEDYEWPCYRCGTSTKPVKIPARVNITGRVVKWSTKCFCDDCKALNLIDFFRSEGIEI